MKSHPIKRLIKFSIKKIAISIVTCIMLSSQLHAEWRAPQMLTVKTLANPVPPGFETKGVDIVFGLVTGIPGAIFLLVGAGVTGYAAGRALKNAFRHVKRVEFGMPPNYRGISGRLHKIDLNVLPPNIRNTLKGMSTRDLAAAGMKRIGVSSIQRLPSKNLTRINLRGIMQKVKLGRF